jgi:hypothetical protein
MLQTKRLICRLPSFSGETFEGIRLCVRNHRGSQLLCLVCGHYTLSETAPSSVSVVETPSTFPSLEQARNLARLGVQIDIVEPGSSCQPRHGRHVADQGVDEFRAGGKSDTVDREGEAGRDTLLGRVVGERERGLGHADGQVCVA